MVVKYEIRQPMIISWWTYSRANMELDSWLLMGLFGGSFGFGIWSVIKRRDSSVGLSRKVPFKGEESSIAAVDFTTAKSAIAIKLAEVERHMLENKEAIEAREKARKIKEEIEAEERVKKAAEAESARLAKLRAEEERLAGERAERLAAEAEELRLEEERLAAEAEEKRLAEEEAQRILDEELAAEEEAKRIEQERIAAEIAEAEASEAEQRRIEEEARATEEERLAAEQVAEEERLLAETEARRVAEAEVRQQEEELQRQRDLAATEEARLIEIAEQKAEEEQAAKEAGERARAELMERLAREGAKSGDVQISLMWNNFNDLDLHVVAPSGERIHGGNRLSACGGELDVDANVRAETNKPVENVVWSAESGEVDTEAPGGTYKVYVHHYKKHKKRKTKDPTSFKVLVNIEDTLSEYEGDLTFGDPITQVCEFQVDAPETRNARKLAAQMALEASEAGEEVDMDSIMEQAIAIKSQEAKEAKAAAAEKAAEDEILAEQQAAEDARLAKEAEERAASEAEAREAEEEIQRQHDIAEGEEIRLAEIASQKAVEDANAKEADDKARAELMERLTREGAKSGDVQVSLMWNNFNDLDLHVVAPSGERIHGGNRISACGGELDVDANVRPDTKKPVENVVWSAESGNSDSDAPGGIYKVYVHHYKKHKKRRSKDPTAYTVLVNVEDKLMEYGGQITFGDPILLVCEFSVDPPEVRNARKEAARLALEAAERGEDVDYQALESKLINTAISESDDPKEVETTVDKLVAENDPLTDLMGSDEDSTVEEVTLESEDASDAADNDDDDDDDDDLVSVLLS
jgi:uncharacterized protein YfaP (DUF2135 family)